MNETNSWFYKGQIFDEKLLAKHAGFVYIITDLETKKKYIGRKYATFTRKKKGARRIRFESDWKDYYGSSKELSAMVEAKGKANFHREIICLNLIKEKFRKHIKKDFY
jgi:hypothetical protein